MNLAIQTLVVIVDKISETQFFALYDGRIVGRVGITLVDDGNYASIRQLFVQPAYGRQGIGSMLMAACHTEAMRWKVDYIILSAKTERLHDWYFNRGYGAYGSDSELGYHMRRNFNYAKSH